VTFRVTSRRHRPQQPATRRKRTKQRLGANSHQRKEFATEGDSWQADENGIARIPASQPSAAAAGSAPFALSPPLWRMCRRSRRESLKPAERRRRRTSRQIAENAYGAKPHREGRGFSREPAWLIRCHDHRMGANRFVYILRRESKPDEPYVGCTSDVPSRLHWRNHGPNGYTTQHRPWRLLAGVECADESTAFRFERYLKTGSVRAFAKRHFG